MADDIDPALIGAAFDLANAGYTTMPDQKRKREAEPIGSDRVSLREAAGHRSPRRDEVVVRRYTGPDGEPVASNEAVTLARAARDYAGAVAAERSATEDAARQDALHAGATVDHSDATEIHGPESPEAGFDEAGEMDQAEAEDGEAPGEAFDGMDDLSATGLDLDLAKALQHPQVRQALEEKVEEAERARQSYREGLDAAMHVARASFLSQFPEFDGMAPENISGALDLMSRRDPSKFARVQSLIATTEQLFARQEQAKRHQAEIARQNFRKFAHAEDARLETLLKGESAQTQQAVAAEIMASAKAAGIEPAELNELLESEPLMRNATFQHMMYDAAKYRLMMKAKAVALAKPVPPVQRPGSATTRSERERTNLRVLSAKLSTSGDIKDAVALYRARQSKR